MLTVHRSKGLEFPIVYYPHLWEPGYIPSGVPVAYHDAARGRPAHDRRRARGPGRSTAHKQQHLVEERGEDLRLAYVALTRAKHQAVVWWAPSWNSRDSALGRLLFARADDGTVPAAGRVHARATARRCSASRSSPPRPSGASASSARGSGCRPRGADRRARPPR